MTTVPVAGRTIRADPRALLAAAHAEATSLPKPLRVWFGILGALLLVGAIGAIRSLFPGDKGVSTTPAFEWGILIVGYVFFAITTSGLCLASSLATVFGIERFRPLEKRHAVLAVLCLTTAFGIIALDLHYPVRMVFGAAFNPSPSSPMWWMGVFYGIYFCFLLVEVWSMFFGHPKIHQAACVLASGMAIVAPSTLGAVFGVLASRPFWHGAFTPVLMVATAFLSGTSLLGVVFYFVWRFRRADFERAATLAIPSIRLLMTVALAAAACLVTQHVVEGLVGTAPGLREATDALLAGPLAVQFWGFRVAGGFLAPLLILWLPATRSPAGVLVAACLSLIGVFVDRLTFVAAGQIAPTTAASGIVSKPYATYVPSPVEIAILVGAVAFVAFAYTLAERYLDLGESDMHVGLPWQRIWFRLSRWAPIGEDVLAEEWQLPVAAIDGSAEATSSAVEPDRDASAATAERAERVEPPEPAVPEEPAQIAPDLSAAEIEPATLELDPGRMPPRPAHPTPKRRRGRAAAKAAEGEQ